LGLYDGDGNFIPPPGTLLDEDGFIILEDQLPGAQAASVAAGEAPVAAATTGAGARGTDAVNLSPRGLTSAVTQ
jgi:hypothetical protein